MFLFLFTCSHGGLSTNGLSDINLIVCNDFNELLEIIFYGRAFHYLAAVGKHTE